VVDVLAAWIVANARHFLCAWAVAGGWMRAGGAFPR